MPFDTTYHIYSGDPNSTIKVVHPGGENIDTFLNAGELPPRMTQVPNADSIIYVTEQYLDQKGLTEKPPYRPGPIFLWIFFGIIFYVAFRAKREAEWERKQKRSEKFLTENDIDGEVIRPTVLTYYGDELDFTNEQYANILTKHYPYYNSLNDEDRTTFIHRVNNFIKEKIFKIHSPEGFREMPVLISAAAIQLTFGLKKYLLTNFDYIHIFPQEFMRVQPTICFLEGNVSGHTINLSWKHFLQGVQLPDDGKNVGLHEMAHALYYQTFVTEENVDHTFRDCFNQFNNSGNKVYNTEMTNEDGLYSDYAMKNFQEFWAESVEIFFERPKEMQHTYPSLYLAIADVLNQDPAARLTT